MKQLDWKPSAIGMLLATNVMRGKYAIFQMINGYISLFQVPISMNFEIRNSQKNQQLGKDRWQLVDVEPLIKKCTTSKRICYFKLKN